VLFDERNAVALTTLQTDDRDAVLLWGLRHGPSLHIGLRTLGYTHTGTD
jgi:hypothetical protein